MKKILLPLLVLGLASAAYAGAACGSGSCDKPQAPAACKCGEKCKDSCGDKCECGKKHCDAPKPETKK